MSGHHRRGRAAGDRVALRRSASRRSPRRPLERRRLDGLFELLAGLEQPGDAARQPRHPSPVGLARERRRSCSPTCSTASRTGRRRTGTSATSPCVVGRVRGPRGSLYASPTPIPALGDRGRAPAAPGAARGGDRSGATCRRAGMLVVVSAAGRRGRARGRRADSACARALWDNGTVTPRCSRERGEPGRARLLRPRRDRARPLAARRRARRSTSTGGVGWVPANHALTPLGPLAEPEPLRLDGRPAPAARPRTQVRVARRARTRARAAAVRHRRDRRPPLGVLPAALPARDARRGSSSELGVGVRASFEHEFQLLRRRAARRCPSRWRRSGAPSRSPARVMGALHRGGRWSPSASSPSSPRTSSRSRWPRARAWRAPTARVRLREVVREVARREGTARELRAAARPRRTRATASTSTSACSTRSGRSALYDPAAPGGLSELGGRFAAGILRHARALSALTAPARSRRRASHPTTGAPARPAWPTQNREALLRIPPLVIARRAASPRASCAWSTAAADATANPYLALGGDPDGAGLDGVRAELDAAAVLDRDPAELQGEQAERFGVGALPALARGGAGGARGRRDRARVVPAAALRRLREPSSAPSWRRPRELDLAESCRRYADDLLTPRSTQLLDGRRATSCPRAVELRHRLHAHPELAHAEHATARLGRRARCRCACERSPGTGRIARVGDGGARGGGGPRRARRAAAERADRRAVQRRRARRCTPAATTSTWRRSWRSRAPRTRSPTSCPAPLLAMLPAERGGLPLRAPRSSRAASSRRSRPRRWWRRTCTPSCRGATVALDAGAVNASCDAVEIVVEGSPPHGAYPHLGRDPILALAEIVRRPARPGRAPDRPARARPR